MIKLCLIIPLMCIPYLVSATDGVDGCHILTGTTMQSRLYYTPYIPGVGSPTEWVQIGSSGAGYNLITATKCFQDTGIPCKVYDYGTTGSSPPVTAVVYTGYYATVTTNCPIDDYTPLFFIFTAGIGFYNIHKRNKYLHENIIDYGSV